MSAPLVTAPGLRRLVLALAHGMADPRSMGLAAEFARDFDLDLLGVYAEDETVLRLPEFPFAREIRRLTHDWHALDPARLSDDLHVQAEAARRHMRQVLDRTGLRGGFEMRRGDPVHCVTEVCSAQDAIVMTVSCGLGQAPMTDLLPAAERSAAAVLVLPDRMVRHRGPVVAVAERVDDPAVALAQALAERQHARLLVLATGVEAGVAGEGEVRVLASLSADDVLRALVMIRGERLVVLAPAAATRIGIEGALRLAAAGSVPVLLA